MKPIVYLETSVISYYTANPCRDIIILAHQEITRQWWSMACDRYNLCISDAVLLEISKGDARAAQYRLAATKGFPVLSINADVETLAKEYISVLGLPPKAKLDALHMACASFYEVEYMVSWNCAHIANAEIISLLSRVNVTKGLQTPIICTPEALHGINE